MSRRCSRKRGHVEVLLIEDDSLDVELLRAVLTREFPARLTFVSTEAEFKAALTDHPPDIIVSDSNVPNFDGMQALHTVRDDFPEVPFVFCSGNNDPEKSHDALTQGAAAWTSKDHDFAQLVQVLKRLCPAD